MKKIWIGFFVILAIYLLATVRFPEKTNKNSEITFWYVNYHYLLEEKNENQGHAATVLALNTTNNRFPLAEVITHLQKKRGTKKLIIRSFTEVPEKTYLEFQKLEGLE